MNIDWSKAPEGTTHGRFIREEDGVALADFYRMDGPKFECFSEMRGGTWVPAFRGPEQCEHRPEPEPKFSILEAEARQAIIDLAANSKSSRKTYDKSSVDP